jgi:hypothetical protein
MLLLAGPGRLSAIKCLRRDSGSPVFPKTTRAGRPQPKSVGCGIGILPMGLHLDGRDARAPRSKAVIGGSAIT